MPHVEGHEYGDIPDLGFTDPTQEYEVGSGQWYANIGSDPANLATLVEAASGFDVDAQWLADYGYAIPLYDPAGEAFAAGEYEHAGLEYGIAGQEYGLAGDIYSTAYDVYGFAGESHQQAQDLYGIAGKAYGMAGEAYSSGLGSVFQQAGSGTRNLMDAWAGSAQRLSGKKLSQRKEIGQKTRGATGQVKEGYKAAGLSYEKAGISKAAADTAYGLAGSKYELAGTTYQAAGLDYDEAAADYALAGIDKAEDIYDRRQEYAKELRQAIMDLANMDAFLDLEQSDDMYGSLPTIINPDLGSITNTSNLGVNASDLGVQGTDLGTNVALDYNADTFNMGDTVWDPGSGSYVPAGGGGGVNTGQSQSDAAEEDSCLVAGSPVLMSNSEYKNIEDIVKGDKIIGWGNRIHTVVELRPMKLGTRKLYGINGDAMFFTEEHPLMTIDGWKALDPERTKRENPIIELERLQVGDIIMQGEYSEDKGFVYKPIEIESIEDREDDPDTDVYNLHLSDGISFHVYDIPFHTIQSGVVVDRYAEEGLDNLCEEDKQRFVTAFSTVPGLMEATAKAFGSTFINIFTKLGHQNG